MWTLVGQTQQADPGEGAEVTEASLAGPGQKPTQFADEACGTGESRGPHLKTRKLEAARPGQKEGQQAGRWQDPGEARND